MLQPTNYQGWFLFQLNVGSAPPAAFASRRCGVEIIVGQGGDADQVGEGFGRVRDGGRIDEMFLKARLDGGFDFVDMFDSVLDGIAGGNIAQGDPRASACGIAG